MCTFFCRLAQTYLIHIIGQPTFLLRVTRCQATLQPTNWNTSLLWILKIQLHELKHLLISKLIQLCPHYPNPVISLPYLQSWCSHFSHPSSPCVNTLIVGDVLPTEKWGSICWLLWTGKAFYGKALWLSKSSPCSPHNSALFPSLKIVCPWQLISTGPTCQLRCGIEQLPALPAINILR